MKINKIAGICKPARLIKLYDEPDGSDVQRMLRTRLYIRCIPCRYLTAIPSAL